MQKEYGDELRLRGEKEGELSIFTIRAYQRFAVCRNACLQHSNGRTQDGLLIELSLQSCRISKIKDGAFSAGQTTKVKIDGYGDLEVQVR